MKRTGGRANFILCVLWLLFILAWCQVRNENTKTTPQVEAIAPSSETSKAAPTFSSFESADMPKDQKDPKYLFNKYFDDKADIMMAICSSEGSFVDRSFHLNNDYKTISKHPKPWINEFKNGSEDLGWCQVNLYYHWERIPGDTKAEKAESLYNPETNVEVAKKVFDSQGFWAWSDYKNGRYLKHLK